ncbi:fibrous sheath-interacting protein 2-like [Calonectris borealis]|uniref:fibrous sheath-interacting protein 2-like n=1 Tax=Calonectris borealis TaxID=1323832 RepID=UPI003F4BAFBE
MFQHLTVIKKRIKRLEALDKEQRLLQQAECQQQQQLEKRRQPGTQSSSKKSALEGGPLHQPSGYFNLGDPYCRLLSTEYNSLHDPHLQAYHKRKDNLQRLKREGYITSDGKVVCTLKELNEYRQYLTTLKVEAEKMFMREEKKLWRDLAKLEDASELPGGSDISRLREWLLQEQTKSLPVGERKRRQR